MYRHSINEEMPLFVDKERRMSNIVDYGGRHSLETYDVRIRFPQIQPNVAHNDVPVPVKFQSASYRLAIYI